MSTALIPHDPHLDLLCDAGLLCDVCQLQPWTQRARHYAALVCADCAAGEPEAETLKGDAPMLTPCPFCGSTELRLCVAQLSTQKISLDGPSDGAYTYTVTHEDVSETDILHIDCRTCDRNLDELLSAAEG